MTKVQRYISAMLLPFLIFLGCNTKEIRLITNINFEMTTSYERVGFVKDALATTIIVTPQKVHPDFEYGVQYKILEGEGYFVAEDGSTIDTEAGIALDPEQEFTANWEYIGTTAGVHKVKVMTYDNFEKSKSETLIYDIKNVDIIWEATSLQTVAKVKDTIAISLVLQNKTVDRVVTFENTIRGITGTGELLDGDKKAITEQNAKAILEGTYSYYYIPTLEGEPTITFDLVDSNGQEKTTAVSFLISEILENQPPVAVLDDIEVTVGLATLLDVLANDLDPEGKALNIVSITEPLNGKAEIIDGKIEYTPNANFLSGNDSFEYTITDEEGLEAIAEVKITMIAREIVFIPDAAFEAVLIALGYDDTIDQAVYKDVVAEITSLDLTGKGISSLEGIAAFVALEVLTADQNNITATIDLTNNINLSVLDLEENGISTLDLSSNIALTTLNLSKNSVSKLDLSNIIMLDRINLDETNITVLDLSKNSKLKSVSLVDGQFLENIILPENADLISLQLNVNKLTALDVSPYANLASLNVQENPGLTCIQVAYVALAEANTNWIKDNTASYAIDCNAPEDTFPIPDAAFEKALIALGHDTIEDGKMLKSDALTVTSLTLNNPDIANLSGIEYFTSLTFFEVNEVNLPLIDLSSNIELSIFKSGSGRVPKMDFSNNLELIAISISDNGLEILDISKNTKLEKLHIDVNNVSTIDISNNPNLVSVYLGDNKLVSIDLSNNSSLEVVQISNNNLVSLDISNSPSLKTMFADNNENLQCIQVADVSVANSNVNFRKDATAYYSLDCNEESFPIPDPAFEQALIASENDDVLDGRISVANALGIIELTGYLGGDISSLSGIEYFANLEILETADAEVIIDLRSNKKLRIFRNNSGTDQVNFTGNPELTEIEMYDSDVRTIDLSGNPKLEILRLEHNSITEIDLSNNLLLNTLNLTENNLTTLDITKHTELATLFAVDCGLEALNLSNNPLLTTMFANNNPNLSCIQVVDVTVANSNINFRKDDTAYYSLDCNEESFPIPDPAFEQALISSGHDEVLDGKISVANALGIKELTSYLGGDISSLSGIEYFANLEILETADAEVIIDLRSNKKLRIFRNNSGTDQVNFTGNPELIEIEMYDSDVRTIDLSGNPKLETLNLGNNILTEIDLSNNLLLNTLNLSENNLATLEITRNTELTTLFLAGCGLEGLDLSKNSKLNNFVASNNNLTTIDLSNNSSLLSVNLKSNQLTSIDVTGNPILNFLEVAQNPDLCIQVADIATANSNTAWSKDATATYSLDCAALKTFSYVDLEFEQALFDLGHDPILDGKMLKSDAAGITSLFISEYDIKNLSDIKYFKGLTSFTGYELDITELDLSSNTLLETLDFIDTDRRINEFDISSNTELNFVIFQNSLITELDISNNSKLTHLQIPGNELTALNTSNNPLLSYLSLSTNKIVSLNLSTNTKLEELYAFGNQLTTLDGSDNTSLRILNVGSNALTELNVSANALLTKLSCQNNDLSTIDVSNNSLLSNFYAVDNTNLTCVQVLDVSAAELNNNWEKDAGATYSTSCP